MSPSFGALHKSRDLLRMDVGMTIDELLSLLPDATLLSGSPNLAISSVVVDSRAAGPGSLFCCIPGTADDGHRYAQSAIERGAQAILTEYPADLRGIEQVAEIRVPVGDARRSMAILSAVVVGRPADQLTMVGVTGTNGKTTVAHLVGEILAAQGFATTVIGTLTGTRTTPPAPELHEMLAGARSVAASLGVRGAVAMEVSSHALDQDRVFGVEFDVAIFTNLTHDHLDYHVTMEAYFEAKARLFDEASARWAVIWSETSEGQALLERRGTSQTSVGWGDAEDLLINRDGTRFVWRGQQVSTGLLGRVNVINTLLAAEAAVALGLEPEAIASSLEGLPAISGRMEVVPGFPESPLVIVDYAHTPDALAGALREARQLAGSGRVVVVFGCGGERDAAKRPMMGRTSSELADVVVITDDNPRSEDPSSIRSDITSGVTGGAEVTVVADRRQAIASAIRNAAVGDVVLIAGKGHETAQVSGSTTVSFDDRNVAAVIMAELQDEAGDAQC